MTPTTNVLQITYLICQGKQTGTAFAIEWQGREYLVTARHVVPDTSAKTKIVHAETWKELPVKGIYHHTGKPDVAVITLDRQISPLHPVEISSDGIMLGQSVILLGFPFGRNYTQYDINNGYPLPFVKSAIFSAMTPKGESSTFILDGHSNPGFSGGPIVSDGNSHNVPKIIGVVTASENERTPHPHQFDPPLRQMNGVPVPDDHVHPTNAGFIIAHRIQHVIEVIEENPYGFKVTS